MVNDKLWENLYWTTELTRPDRLAKMLNIIIRKEDDDEYFLYNGEIVNEATKIHSTNILKPQDNRIHLTYYEKLRLRQIDQQLDLYNLNLVNIGKNRSNTTLTEKGRSGNPNLNQLKTNKGDRSKKRLINATNDQKILNREEVTELLRQLSAHVYLGDERVEPRPIDVRLVKVGKLATNMKLFSDTVPLRMRLNIHKLPVRCKLVDNNPDEKSKSRLMSRIDQLENLVRNLSNQVNMKTSDRLSILMNICRHNVQNNVFEWNKLIIST